MYKYIICPQTKKSYKVKSRQGTEILLNYTRYTYEQQVAGSVAQPVNIKADMSAFKDNLLNEINDAINNNYDKNYIDVLQKVYKSTDPSDLISELEVVSDNLGKKDTLVRVSALEYAYRSGISNVYDKFLESLEAKEVPVIATPLQGTSITQDNKTRHNNNLKRPKQTETKSTDIELIRDVLKTREGITPEQQQKYKGFIKAVLTDENIMKEILAELVKNPGYMSLPASDKRTKIITYFKNYAEEVDSIQPTVTPTTPEPRRMNTFSNSSPGELVQSRGGAHKSTDKPTTDEHLLYVLNSYRIVSRFVEAGHDFQKGYRNKNLLISISNIVKNFIKNFFLKTETDNTDGWTEIDCFKGHFKQVFCDNIKIPIEGFDVFKQITDKTLVDAEDSEFLIRKFLNPKHSQKEASSFNFFHNNPYTSSYLAINGISAETLRNYYSQYNYFIDYGCTKKHHCILFIHNLVNKIMEINFETKTKKQKGETNDATKWRRRFNSLTKETYQTALNILDKSNITHFTMDCVLAGSLAGRKTKDDKHGKDAQLYALSEYMNNHMTQIVPITNKWDPASTPPIDENIPPGRIMFDSFRKSSRLIFYLTVEDYDNIHIWYNKERVDWHNMSKWDCDNKVHHRYLQHDELFDEYEMQDGSRTHKQMLPFISIDHSILNGDGDRVYTYNNCGGDYIGSLNKTPGVDVWLSLMYSAKEYLDNKKRGASVQKTFYEQIRKGTSRYNKLFRKMTLGKNKLEENICECGHYSTHNTRNCVICGNVKLRNAGFIFGKLVSKYITDALVEIESISRQGAGDKKKCIDELAKSVITFILDMKKSGDYSQIKWGKYLYETSQSKNCHVVNDKLAGLGCILCQLNTITGGKMVEINRDKLSISQKVLSKIKGIGGVKEDYTSLVVYTCNENKDTEYISKLMAKRKEILDKSLDKSASVDDNFHKWLIGKPTAEISSGSLKAFMLKINDDLPVDIEVLTEVDGDNKLEESPEDISSVLKVPPLPVAPPAAEVVDEEVVTTTSPTQKSMPALYIKSSKELRAERYAKRVASKKAAEKAAEKADEKATEKAAEKATEEAYKEETREEQEGVSPHETPREERFRKRSERKQKLIISLLDEIEEDGSDSKIEEFNQSSDLSPGEIILNKTKATNVHNVEEKIRTYRKPRAAQMRGAYTGGSTKSTIDDFSNIGDHLIGSEKHLVDYLKEIIIDLDLDRWTKINAILLLHEIVESFHLFNERVFSDVLLIISEDRRGEIESVWKEDVVLIEEATPSKKYSTFIKSKCSKILEKIHDMGLSEEKIELVEEILQLFKSNLTHIELKIEYYYKPAELTPSVKIVDTGESSGEEKSQQILYKAVSDAPGNAPLSLGDWWHKTGEVKDYTWSELDKRVQEGSEVLGNWVEITNYAILGGDTDNYIYSGDREIEELLSKLTKCVTENKRFLDFLLEILSIAEIFGEAVGTGCEEGAVVGTSSASVEICEIKELYKRLVFKVTNFFNLYINKELRYGGNVGVIDNIGESIKKELEKTIGVTLHMSGAKLKEVYLNIDSGALDVYTGELDIGTEDVLQKFLKFYIYRKDYDIREELLKRIFDENKVHILVNYRSLNFTEYNALYDEGHMIVKLIDALTYTRTIVEKAIIMEKIKLKLKIADYNDVIKQDITTAHITKILAVATEYTDAVESFDYIQQKNGLRESGLGAGIRVVDSVITQLTQDKRAFFNMQIGFLQGLVERLKLIPSISVLELTVGEFMAFFYLKDITYDLIKADEVDTRSAETDDVGVDSVEPVLGEV